MALLDRRRLPECSLESRWPVFARVVSIGSSLRVGGAGSARDQQSHHPSPWALPWSAQAPRRVFEGAEFDSSIYFEFRAIRGRGRNSQKFYIYLFSLKENSISY